MLDEKQLELAKAEPKEFLQQYKLLTVQAESKLSRIDFWQNYEAGKGLCKELLAEARQLITLKADIAETIKSADISEQYKALLNLRYVKGLTILETTRELNFKSRRWCTTVQARALKAFAQAI